MQLLADFSSRNATTKTAEKSDTKGRRSSSHALARESYLANKPVETTAEPATSAVTNHTVVSAESRLAAINYQLGVLKAFQPHRSMNVIDVSINHEEYRALIIFPNYPEDSMRILSICDIRGTGTKYHVSCTILPPLVEKYIVDNNDLMDETTHWQSIVASALKKGLTVAELEDAIEEKLAAKAEITVRQIRGAAPAARIASKRARHEARVTVNNVDWRPPSVPLPNGLRWPTEQFNDSPEFKKRDGILRHLERVWKPLIASGSIDMALLRMFYLSTARAIDTFKHNDGKEPRELPGDLDIPLLKAGAGRRRKSRLAATVS